jgi:uncharacterized caspase-like protein
MKTNSRPPTHFLSQKILYVLIFFFGASLLAACSSTKTVQKPPPFRYDGTTIAKGIDASGNLGVPTDVTDTVSAEDEEVYAHLKLENISGEHKVRWEWYDPDGALYYATDSTPLNVRSGNYLKRCTAWHKLTIKGDKAADMLGDWEVKVYFDNDLLDTKRFALVAAKAIFESAPLKGTQQMYPKDWALVIGIEDYARLPRVDFARKDALVVKEYFNKILGVPEQNIITLIDGDATKARITGYLKKFIPANVSKDTTLYVYFAGHGAPNMQTGEPYIVPYDGDTLFIEETAYSLKEFYKEINDLHVNQAYVFLDSCFSGVASRAAEMLTKGARPALMKVQDIGLATQEVIALSAASSNQTSNAYPEKEQGLFTYYLLKALRGDADENEDRFVSIKEIYDYVSKNVTRAARRMGEEQTPVITPSLDILKDVSVSRVTE